MNNFKMHLLAILLISFSSFSWAGGFHCDSAQSGLWSSTSTWTNCNGTIPTTAAYVTIKANHEVTLDVNSANLNGFNVEAGGGFKVAASATGLTLSSATGDVINFDFSLASIELAGDFTIDVVNRDVILGAVDGAFDLTVNCPDETRIEGVIGGISPLNNLLTDSDGTLDLYNNITVVNKITLNDPTTSFNSISINADNIIIDNDLFISNGDFTFNSSNSSISTITGVISGSDDFVKEGVGDVEIFTVNSLTGNVILNGGSITNPGNSENIFPDIAVFSLASGTQGAFASNLTDIFELTAGQSIIGSGYIPDKVDRQQNVIVNISPGFSPGQLTFDRLYVDEFATLTFELNGTTAGTEYDQIVILENVELEYDLENGSSLDVSLGFTPNVGDEFIIIDNQSGNSVGDRFMDLDEGAIINVGQFRFSLSYIGGDGNDVVLTNIICQSAQDGLWSDSTTWVGCDGLIPQATDIVYISHEVSLDTDVTIAAIDGTGSLIVLAAGYTLSVTDDIADFDLIDIVLFGDFTINNTNNNILIGGFDGNSNSEILTLNSIKKVIFAKNFATTIGIGAIVTDAGGTTNINQARTFKLTGNSDTVFNDDLFIGPSAKINFNHTGIGNLIFNQDILLFSGGPKTITINKDLGQSEFNGAVSIGELNTNGAANVLISGGSITTNSGGSSSGLMTFNSPVVITNNTIFTSAGSGNGSITFNNSLDDDGNVGTTSAVTINSPNSIKLSGVGNINPLDSLTTDAIGTTTINADINTLLSTRFNGAVTLGSPVKLSGAIVDFKSSVNNAGFNLTFDTSDDVFTGIDGVLSGSGDFINEGNGRVGFSSVNDMTGNLFIDNGSVVNLIDEETVFPSVPLFSIAMGAEATLGNDADFFSLLNGQTLQGNGECNCLLGTKSGSVISPGFSPGKLSTDEVYMVTGTTLSIELNGPIVGTDYDQLSVFRAYLNEGTNPGATLDLSLGYIPSVNDSFIILETESMDAVTGRFNGLEEGAQLSVDGILFNITYVGGDGNDVVLTILGSSILYVNENVVVAGDGSSWSNAFDNIQDALAVANMGNEIWVAQGVYYPDEGASQVNNERLSTFTLVNDVNLYGGFVGSETNLSQRNPSTNITILSGDIDVDVDGGDTNIDNNNIAESVTDLRGNNAYHVVNGRTVDISSIVDGFTITSGNANGGKGESIGGGITCDESISGPRINQVIFIGNKAVDFGGATYGCTEDVQNSSYLNNESGGSGGAVSTKSGNFDKVIFEGNYAEFTGGALSSTVGLIVVNHASFKNNSSDFSGGALYKSGELIISDTLFLGNSSAQNGGAINIDDGPNAVLTNVTITGNKALASGGGIRTDSSGTFNMRNSIVWNNQDTTGSETFSSSINSSVPILISNSLVQGFGANGTNLDEDPRFTTSTNPVTAPNTTGNARLQSTSIAIDTGNNVLVTSATDLDGRNRLFNTIVDMGAYEYFEEEIFKDGFE